MDLMSLTNYGLPYPCEELAGCDKMRYSSSMCTTTMRTPVKDHRFVKLCVALSFVSAAKRLSLLERAEEDGGVVSAEAERV